MVKDRSAKVIHELCQQHLEAKEEKRTPASLCESPLKEAEDLSLEDYTSVTFQYLAESMRLGAGHSFGELALMHRTKSFKRAASVISREQTHVAVLSKEDFQRVYLS